ncbi:MAG: DegT/DnrJ/EryC1/StrS family aminotransferase [Coriobacteriia bacterium]|nr:DegT/DnrJ/EryC1/StrS family aminotransferase [Coriobacteriia bacterium]
MEKLLAIDGGSSVRVDEFPPWPQIDRAGIEAVEQVLHSGKLNYHVGVACTRLEEVFAAYCEVPYALAVSNGTVALEIALRAWGVGAGDEVIVPSRTFIATAGAVVSVGATPVIADIDPETNCLTALACAKVLTPRTKAIIAVHLGGYPAPLASLKSLADQVGAVVIEDCAQALGARSGGAPVGSQCAAGCFSFCQDKIISLGEGGMITFTDEYIYNRAWSYRDHGCDPDLSGEVTVGETRSQFRWLRTSFGTNARMTEMQGALGLWAMDHLEGWHTQRRENAQVLIDAMAQIDGITAIVPATDDALTEHAFYRLYGAIDTAMLSKDWSRDRVIDAINAEGVPVQYGSCSLIGNEAAFAHADIPVNPDLVGAHRADETSIAFFVHPSATRADMQDVATALRKVMAVALC